MKTGLVFGLALLLVSVAAADWSDNFDSYDSGSGIYGQGGWITWDLNPAADAYVTAAMSQSAPNALEVIPTSDVVQEFNITEGDWVLTAWNYIPAAAVGDQFLILLTYYEAASSDWALQLKFNNTTGQLKAQEGTVLVDIIRDQWVEVKVEVFLAANQMNIYYNGAFVETLPWSPTSGIYEFDAIDVFSDGGDTIYWDDFVLEPAMSLTPTTWASIKASIK